MLKRYALAAIAAAAVAPVGLAAPAHADTKVYWAFWEGKGRAWTNSAHNRVGVEDLSSDRIRIYVEAMSTGGDHLLEPDTNDSDAGHSAYPVTGKVTAFRVCGWYLDNPKWLGCSDVVFPDNG